MNKSDRTGAAVRLAWSAASHSSKKTSARKKTQVWGKEVFYKYVVETGKIKPYSRLPKESSAYAIATMKDLRVRDRALKAKELPRRLITFHRIAAGKQQRYESVRGAGGSFQIHRFILV
ncbi:hypothetical protein Q7P36_007136 [Cladosporium allicinum]